MLYTDPSTELRWSTQGNFWILSSGVLAGALECGKIILDYEIDFAVPDYRGVIQSPTSGSMTLNYAVGSAGFPFNFTGTLPATGVYFLRIDSTPTTSCLVSTTKTAYDMQAPTITLQKGIGVWLYVPSTGGTAYILWSPCFYDRSMLTNAMVCQTAVTAGSFTGVIYGYAPISND
jgi:hypothetical protein